ncbi:MAG: Hsp20/alpha crystallin family protein [Candidatus Paceibacterota bacterium]
MPKDKRSFFERITGTISVADDREDFDYEHKVAPPPATTAGREYKEEWIEEQAEEGELTVDVYQTPTEIVIQTMVAGVKPEDLNINITREMVTIKGERERLTGVVEEDYFQKELYWGSFTRTILLPAEVETEEAEASEKHGLLTIRLPKIDKDRVQKLKVKTG